MDSTTFDVLSQSSLSCRASRVRLVERVELCCSISSTQPKCMGSTCRTCRRIETWRDKPSGGLYCMLVLFGITFSVSEVKGDELSCSVPHSLYVNVLHQRVPVFYGTLLFRAGWQAVVSGLQEHARRDHCISSTRPTNHVVLRYISCHRRRVHRELSCFISFCHIHGLFCKKVSKPRRKPCFVYWNNSCTLSDQQWHIISLLVLTQKDCLYVVHFYCHIFRR